jgi:S1-C subfamily serine protease
MKAARLIGVACALGMVVCASARAGELEEKSRAILEKSEKSVVVLQLVIKQTLSAPNAGSQESEATTEATGTIIAASGLTVLSLSSIDVGSLYENMMSSMDEGARVKFESNVTDVKILTNDGTEIPAKVVLRDKDLDLAFIMPVEKPAQPLPAVDFAQAGSPQVFDPLVALNRLGKVAGRICAGSIERVQGIMRKPRTLYIPGNDPTFSGLGSPVFGLDGKVVGIITMRSIKSEGKGGPMGGMDQSTIATIIPAADILDAAKQAEAPPESKPEQK